MSSSLKGRFISVSLLGAYMFALCAVLTKLISPREDWLVFSIMWAISCAAGDFVSKSITKATEDLSIIKVILIDAILSILVGIVMAFITGVLFSLSNWEYIVSNTCIPFAMAMLVYNKWQRN